MDSYNKTIKKFAHQCRTDVQQTKNKKKYTRKKFAIQIRDFPTAYKYFV